jgi:hypothetical protein
MPFKWYMDKIGKIMLKKFPYPPKNHVWGECYSPSNKVCLDEKGLNFGERIGVKKCNGKLRTQVSLKNERLRFGTVWLLIIIINDCFIAFSIKCKG